MDKGHNLGGWDISTNRLTNFRPNLTDGQQTKQGGISADRRIDRWTDAWTDARTDYIPLVQAIKTEHFK